jgi:ribosomal-protein-alanine N-acetyltransferase
MSGEAAKPQSTIIRRLRGTDTFQAAEIFQESRDAAQWSAASLRESLATGSSGWAAERDGRVAGVLISRSAGDEFEILNLAVAAQSRREGIGSSLVDTALRAAKSEGCRTAHLEVRVSNVPAIDLYRAHGFAEVGRRKQYYQDPAEDALLFACDLVEKY